MSRSYVERRQFLLSVGAGSVVGLAGCSGGDGGGSPSKNELPAEWNYKEYDRVRFQSQSEGVFFESDDETQYVGVQLKVTNNTGGSANLLYLETTPELTLFADGSSGDVGIHNKSTFTSLERVGAGETAEATLLYTTPPETSTYMLKPRENSERTYNVTRDKQLEIELVDLSDS